MEDVKQLAERQLGDDSIQLDCINMHNVVNSRTETTVFGPVKHSFIRCRFVVYVKSSGTGVTKMVLTWKSILEKVDTLYQEHEIDPEKDPTVSLINADFSNTEDLINAIKLHLRALGINYHCINVKVDSCQIRGKVILPNEEYNGIWTNGVFNGEYTRKDKNQEYHYKGIIIGSLPVEGVLSTQTDSVKIHSQIDSYLWANDVDTSCASFWNSQHGQLRAGTLLTKRHVLFANHFLFDPIQKKPDDIFGYNAVLQQILQKEHFLLFKQQL